MLLMGRLTTFLWAVFNSYVTNYPPMVFTRVYVQSSFYSSFSFEFMSEGTSTAWWKIQVNTLYWTPPFPVDSAGISTVDDRDEYRSVSYSATRRWVPDFGYGSDNPISVLQLARALRRQAELLDVSWSHTHIHTCMYIYNIWFYIWLCIYIYTYNYDYKWIYIYIHLSLSL